MFDNIQGRRKFMLSSTAIGIAATAPAILKPTAALAAPDVVRDGLTIGAQGAIRIALPQVQAKYNLDFSYKEFPDSTSILLALDQGELDYGVTTAQHLIRAISEGIDVVWVLGWGGGYNVLIAGKAFGIAANDPAALQAKVMERKKAGSPVKIAAPTGSMQHAKLALYLKSLNIDPDKDVQILNLPFRNHPRAIESGEVDLAMTLSVFGAISLAKGDAVLVKHVFDGPFGKQEIGFIVRRRTIAEKKDYVQRMVSAHVDAMKLFMGNMDQQIAYEKKYSRLDQPVLEMQEREFLRYDYRTRVADIKQLAKELHQLGWVKADVSDKVDSVIDLSFAAKAAGIPVADMTTW